MTGKAQNVPLVLLLSFSELLLEYVTIAKTLDIYCQGMASGSSPLTPGAPTWPLGKGIRKQGAVGGGLSFQTLIINICPSFYKVGGGGGEFCKIFSPVPGGRLVQKPEFCTEKYSFSLAEKFGGLQTALVKLHKATRSHMKKQRTCL